MISSKVSFKPEGARIDPLIFGNFIEFIENCIDGGICDPSSPASDENGIRLDVKKLAKDLRPTMLRWPGGTVTAIYHWEDGIGPKENRKKKRNLIWGGINDNTFGTAEFVKYCRDIGAEPMICVNMASGTAEEAANWVEYCNGQPGSYYADLRVSHGYPEPFNVKYWCVGNESYAEPDLGPQHDVNRYIADGWEFTKHMKLTDPSIKLVFVGDSSHSEWNEKVLAAFSPVCDYFSIHHYSGEGQKGCYEPFASLYEFDRLLDEMIPMLHEYSEKQGSFNKWYRFPGRSAGIKFVIDEWNIWNSAVCDENNRYGLKMKYNWRDALWTACMLNLFARKAEDIGGANLAQMVNVIAPIMTSGDNCYVQTTYHVLKAYRDAMCGANIPLDFAGPTFIDDKAGSIKLIDLAAAKVSENTVRLFAVNLSQDEDVMLELALPYKAISSTVLSAPDFKSINTVDTDCVSVETKSGADALNIEKGTVNIIELSL